MKNFFQKQREIIVILVYVGIIAALVYFVIFSMISKIEGVNNQIQEGKIKQDMVKQKLAELPKIQQQYADINEKENLMDVFLNKDKAVILIEKLEKLAQNSDNEIKISIQASQPQKKATSTKNKKTVEETLISKLPSTDYLQVQTILRGSYNNIINFISKLENMENYADIIGIKIKQGTPDASSSFGSVNPFNSDSSANADEIFAENTEKNLEATLDVVFYTKK